MKFTVTEEFHNTYLKRYLNKLFEKFDGEVYRELLEKNQILINGACPDKDYQVKEGDGVEVLDEELELRRFYELTQEEMEFIKESIVYEDERILVFNKKPNYTVHKGAYKDKGLVDLLKTYTNNHNFAFVNRIDRDTSGLILGAKTLPVVRELNKEIEEKRIKKYYYILINGVPPEDNFEIINYLKKGARRVVEVDENHPEGKRSITKFTVLKRGSVRSVVEADLITGRTHQLRVQLSAGNMPIVGDRKYGREKKEELCLFSHRIIIPIYSLDINLDIPKEFIKKLK